MCGLGYTYSESTFVFYPFFFGTRFRRFKHCYGYCLWIVAATFDYSPVNSASVHCLRTHKLHFSTTFLLKMGLTVLFTHLKIILLQCFQFSVFNFRSNLSNFQLFTRDEILGNTIWKLWWNFLAFKFLCKSKEPSNLIETFLVFLMETFLVGINLLYCKL